MKKLRITVMCIIALCMCGCSKQAAYPAYFEPIAEELETVWEDSGYFMDKWRDNGGLEGERGEYQDKMYTRYVDDNVYEYDLTAYLTASEEWEWLSVGAFRNESGENTYNCLLSFDSTLFLNNGMLNPQILLLEYPTDDPSDYQITPYNIEPYGVFLFYNSCYRIKNNIYIETDDTLGVINLDTKEFRYCADERAVLAEYATEFIGENPYYMYHFSAVYEQDSVIVYSATIAEASDVDLAGIVYVAIKDGEPIAYMSVDYTADNFEDAINVEIVE